MLLEMADTLNIFNVFQGCIELSLTSWTICPVNKLRCAVLSKTLSYSSQHVVLLLFVLLLLLLVAANWKDLH